MQISSFSLFKHFPIRANYVTLEFGSSENSEFLVKCSDNNLIPKFLNFCLANRSLRFSLTYAHCQSNLLLEEIKF